MKMFYSPYSLKPVSPLNAVSVGGERQGVLVKIQWPDGRIGYADLHPWPELGDQPLEEHLSLLREGKISTQVEQAIWFARRDAEMRKQKKNFFDAGLKVRNNFTVGDYASIKEGQLDQLKQEGFSILKVKIGRNLDAEMEFLGRAAHKGFALRLDMNGIGSWQIFEKIMTGLDPKTFAFTEYVEDPFPYDEDGWIEANSLVKIALDNQYDKVVWDSEKLQNAKNKPFDVIVLKPAKQDVDTVIELCKERGLQTTVTSYMGHPVGMMHALAVAMEIKKAHGPMVLDPGCLTHRLYHMESFAAEIPFHGPFISKVQGHGIGFDSLLEMQSWYQIKLR